LEYVIAVLLGMIGSLIAWEITLHYRKWCEAIIRLAARQLPDEQRTIREEEWLAALNDCVGLISAFAHAGGCWIGAAAVARNSPKIPVAQTKTENSKIGKNNVSRSFNLLSEVEKTFRRSNRLMRLLLEWSVLATVCAVMADIVYASGGARLFEIIRTWLQHF
jgi:hypothetical protein